MLAINANSCLGLPLTLSRRSRSSSALTNSALIPNRLNNSSRHLLRSIAGQITSNRRASNRALSSVQIKPASIVFPRPTSSAMRMPLLGESKNCSTGLN
ncbi:hypothetical protein FQZ97_591900 [compost metagenome]